MVPSHLDLPQGREAGLLQPPCSHHGFHPGHVRYQAHPQAARPGVGRWCRGHCQDQYAAHVLVQPGSQQDADEAHQLFLGHHSWYGAVLHRSRARQTRGQELWPAQREEDDHILRRRIDARGEQVGRPNHSGAGPVGRRVRWLLFPGQGQARRLQDVRGFAVSCRHATSRKWQERHPQPSQAQLLHLQSRVAEYYQYQ